MFFTHNSYTFRMHQLHLPPKGTRVQRLARRFGSLVAATGLAIGLIATPVTAQAQPVDLSANVSSTSPFLQQAEHSLQAAAMTINNNARNAVWDVRNALRVQATNLAGGNKAQEQQFHADIDRLVESIAPGLIAERTPRPAPAPAPAPVPQPNQPAGCAPTARACVDIANQRTWLQENGKVTYGPVRMASGKPGQDTPKGFHRVNRKVRDEISFEFDNAPMPFATYFTYNGIAFHQGDPSIKSAGCIRMYRADAQHYFNTLRIGDQVHVF